MKLWVKPVYSLPRASLRSCQRHAFSHQTWPPRGLRTDGVPVGFAKIGSEGVSDRLSSAQAKEVFFVCFSLHIGCSKLMVQDV